MKYLQETIISFTIVLLSFILGAGISQKKKEKQIWPKSRKRNFYAQ